MTTKTEYQRERNLLIVVVVVIVILAILRSANIGISGARPLGGTGLSYVLAVISTIVMIFHIWYFTKYTTFQKK